MAKAWVKPPKVVKETIHIKQRDQREGDDRLWFYIYIGREMTEHFCVGNDLKGGGPLTESDAELGRTLRNVLTRARDGFR